MDINPASSSSGDDPSIPPGDDDISVAPPPAPTSRSVPEGMPPRAERPGTGEPPSTSRRTRQALPGMASASSPSSASSASSTPSAQASAAQGGTRDEPPAWPARVSMLSYLQGRSGALQREPSLGVEGRALPPLKPQAIGCDFAEPVGKWPRSGADREKLGPAVTANLTRLAALGEGRTRNQLHMEITTMWHALCDAEKGDVLNTLATEQVELLGDTNHTASPNQVRTPVRDWFDHMVLNMDRDTATQLLNSTTPQAQHALTAPMRVANADPDLRAHLDERFVDLAASMPVDHQVDYRGFLERTNRVVGSVPDAAKDIRIGIVGAGPAGIMAADLANRVGFRNVEVLEQAGVIGGRLATERLDGVSDPFHPGAMRFHRDRNNAYWGLAEHYGLEHAPFPNPGSPGVPVTYMLGGKVFTVEPGELADNEVLRKVSYDIDRAMTQPLFKPMEDARKAGDTAEVRRLWDKMKRDYDHVSFRDGVDRLLAEQDIEWTEEEWDMFGAVGIGVGGYKGYSDIGFLEEARFISDGRLRDHVALKAGADAPLHELIKDRDGLPQGTGSLEDQGVIKLNSEVKAVERIGGKYHVSVLDKTTGQLTEHVYDELMFSGSPREALRLGLHTPAPGTEPMLPDKFVESLKKANLVSATKAAFGVAFGSIRDEDLPANIQTDEFNQQSYVIRNPDGTGLVYSEYAQGRNADKAAGMSVEDRRDGYINLLRSVAAREPGEPEHEKIGNLAELLAQNRDRYSYMNWGEERHFWGAFKMDAPGDAENTRRLFGFLVNKYGNDAILFGEMYSAEGGFASGAIASATNGMQKLIVRHDGTLPQNSPFHQELL